MGLSHAKEIMSIAIFWRLSTMHIRDRQPDWETMEHRRCQRCRLINGRRVCWCWDEFEYQWDRMNWPTTRYDRRV